MGDFIVGVDKKYPKELLKNRIVIEGNVISCFMKDILLLDEVSLKKESFITSDGRFYFGMLSILRGSGLSELKEVDIIAKLPERIVEAYDERGGWEAIQHLIDIVSVNNFDSYLDSLYRENIMLNMYDDGFNLLTKIKIDDNDIIPIQMFRKMTAEEVLDWYEARIGSYGSGYSAKVLEEEEIDFDDEFIQSCADGEENGIPFATAGKDIYGEDINCFPFITRRLNGLLEGTLTTVGGYSSSGKSTLWITIIMSLLSQGRKVLIISNEENVKKFKIKFMVWLLAKRNKYFKLSKKGLMSGNMTKKDREELAEIQEFWKNNYKGNLKFIAIPDANMSLVKKKIRENVLRFGYDTVLYDTLKLDFDTAGKDRQDLSLIKDTRDLDYLAKKYNIIMLVSLQLAIHTIGKLFLDASCLSTSKQAKETMENLILMRNTHKEELDPKSKYYCSPFRKKKLADDKWIEEPYEPDPNRVWRTVFIDKCRSGQNSSDDGVAFLMTFQGDYAIFKETCMCRPKHGEIR